VGAYGLVGGVLGAKLSMLVFLGPQTFWRLLPTIPQYGAAWTGALFGGYVAVVLAERALGVDRCTGDMAAPFIPLAQAIGRMGNFLAADAYGTVTSVPWAVHQAGAWRHPVQLYELAFDLALFGFLWFRRYRSYRDGELFRIYVIAYALACFPLEWLRVQPAGHAVLGLTLVQWFFLLTLAGCCWQLVLERRGVACICALVPDALLPRRLRLGGLAGSDR
jgi:phosphatidylglycerol:prolipoprotein diacylglycerol transferase